MNQYCETFIKIDKSALIHNAQFFKKYSNKKLIAVIKSNAYGHGLIEVGKILEKEADLFAVASLDSALSLRKANIKIPILVLNPLASKYTKVALDNDIMITINNIDEVKQINDILKDEEKSIKLHLKIDTGMNRMGIKKVSEAKDIISYINNCKNLDLVGIYTHFHSPDNNLLSKKQQNLFKHIFNNLEHKFQYIHLCSTSATLNNWDIEESTHVRIGLGLYGIYDNDNVIPVLSMYSKIMLKKLVMPQESVGYNARFIPKQKTWIGVLPLGYSDGIIRANSGRKVYVDGYYCEIIGNVCMNSLMIKLPKKDIGDTVEIIGTHIKAIDIAKHLNTISYEVTTLLPPHIKRIVV